MAQQQLASTLGKCKHNSHQKAADLKSYKTPMDNSAAVAQRVKETKQAAAMQLVQLEQKYGKDGAAAMQQTMQMTPLKYRWQHKVISIQSCVSRCTDKLALHCHTMDCTTRLMLLDVMLMHVGLTPL